MHAKVSSLVSRDSFKRRAKNIAWNLWSDLCNQAYDATALDYERNPTQPTSHYL